MQSTFSNSKTPLPRISELQGQKHPVFFSNSVLVARGGDEGTEQPKITQPQANEATCEGQQRGEIQLGTGRKAGFLSDPSHGKPVLPTGHSGMKSLYTRLLQGHAHSTPQHTAGRRARPSPQHTNRPQLRAVRNRSREPSSVPGRGPCSYHPRPAGRWLHPLGLLTAETQRSLFYNKVYY